METDRHVQYGGLTRQPPPLQAHFDEAAEAEAALAALRGGFEADPISFEARGLHVMYRDGKRGRFRPLEGPRGWLGFGEEEEPMAFEDMPTDDFLSEAGVPPPWSRDAPGRGPRRRKRRQRRPQEEEEGGPGAGAGEKSPR